MPASVQNPPALALERPYKDESGLPLPDLLDIAPDGQHIYEPTREPVQALGENLRRIFIERGTDFFHKQPHLASLDRAGDDRPLAQDDEDPHERIKEDDTTALPMTTEELIKMRMQILPQLYIALGEVSHARDLLVLLSPSPQLPPDASLPSDALSSTIVTKPEAIPSVQAFNSQLAVGGKDESLRKAADVLKSAATRVERGRTEGEKYWVDALKIRRSNWGLTPAPLPFGSASGRGADRTSKDFLISFGLEESPVSLRRRAVGHLAAYDAPSGTLVFPHRQKTRLRVTLAPTRGSPHDHVSHNRVIAEEGGDTSLAVSLQAAQREVVEQEIFSVLIKEASNLPTASARVSERLIVIEAAQDTELRFELVDCEVLEASTPARDDANSAKCDLIYCALHLLLLRSHAHAKSRRLGSVGIARLTPPAGTPVPPNLPVLQPIIDLLQYETFCERVQTEMEKMAKVLTDAGVPCKTRFEVVGDSGPQLVKMLTDEQSRRIGGEAILRVDNRHTIRFTFLSPSSLTAHLPQATLAVSSIPQLCQLLSDEVEQCLLSRICEVGNDLCESVSGTWFVDLLSGRSVGKWEGCVLNFRVFYGAHSSIQCSVFRLSRGQAGLGTLLDSYHFQQEGISLLEWVRRKIEAALQER